MIAILASTVTGCTGGDESDPELEAMITDPDAALEFFYPDGVVEAGTSPTAIEYIRDRNWSDEEFDTLARALDAATTAHRTKDDPKAELSALAATDTINLLAERDTLPDTIDDSIGHIIANYIVDVNFVAAINDTPDSYDGLDSQFYLDLPPGARFSPSALRKLLPPIMGSERGAEQVIDATNHLVNARIANNISPGAADPDHLKADALFGTRLLGFVIGAALTSDNSSPEWITSLTTSFAATTTALPAPGTTFAEYITTQAKETGQNYTQRSAPPTTSSGYPSDPDSADLFVDVASTALVNAVGIQLGHAGLLIQPSDTDPPPWFVDNKFDADIARQSPDRFEDYLARGYPEWGDTTTPVIHQLMEAQVQYW